MITELRLRLEKNKYDMEGITDPGVPASLFKLWLRELADPVIPPELYEAAIRNSDNATVCVDLVADLPDLNRRVILFVIGFLQVRLFLSSTHLLPQCYSPYSIAYSKWPAQRISR